MGPTYDEVLAEFDVDDTDIDFEGEDDDVNLMEPGERRRARPSREHHPQRDPQRRERHSCGALWLRVRYRVDGVLHEEMAPPLRLKNAISSRLKS